MVRLAIFRARTARPTQHVAQQAQQFVRNAFDVDRRNTRHVQLARCLPVAQGWRCTTVTKIPGERARRHVQLVYLPRGYRGSFRACQHIRIDCDCGRHVFVWNHALYEAGLAVRDRTNGEPADVTNPAARLGACKHMIIDLRYLIGMNPRFPHAAQSDGGMSTDGTIRLTTIRRARR